MIREYIEGRYNLYRELGRGTYGHVFLAKNIETDYDVAVKLEKKSENSQLGNEVRIVKHIQGRVGFPKMISSGSTQNHHYMVSEVLGPNLEDLLHHCGGTFSLKTVLRIGIQGVSRLEFLHDQGFVHKDIKPEKFLVGLHASDSIIYLNGFGLGKQYKNKKTLKHIEYKQYNIFTGAARYTSLNSHRGAEKSRRDDLESLAYVLIYLLNGRLPWQGVEGRNKQEKFAKIAQLKQNIPLEILCEQSEDIKLFLNICRKLSFTDHPPYEILKGILTEAMIKNGIELDHPYDWVVLNYPFPEYNQQREINPRCRTF